MPTSAAVSSRPARALLSALALAACVAGAAAQPSRPGPAPGGGSHLLYIGGYDGAIHILDEATGEKVGAIPLATGVAWSLTLSQSRTKFYATNAMMDRFEIIDIPTRSSLASFTLSDGSRRTRIFGMQVDPLERFAVLLTRDATRLVDRWEIGDITIQVFDFAQKKVTRAIPWPRGEEREFLDIRFSPDGKWLYFFGDDVLIYETEGFTEVDTWPLSRPIEAGLGRLSFGPVDDVNEDPGFFTGLFIMQDPVQKRRMMGLGRVDLVGKRVDFTPIGPPESVGFALSPDRKKGYGLVQQIGRYELWTFDVEQKRLVSRTPFAGRPRMSLRVSSDGRRLYIFNAGPTIDVYDAATFTFVRTITMAADQTTGLFILPRP